MKEEDYFKEKRIIENLFKAKMGILDSKYFKQNNTIKIGDILICAWGRIRVNSINHINPKIWSTGKPTGIYKGIRLTTKNVPFRQEKIDTIYECNIQKIIRGS